jgi:hypothetical protein
LVLDIGYWPYKCSNAIPSYYCKLIPNTQYRITDLEYPIKCSGLFMNRG